jgi:uracil-DNA glycosylase
MEKRRFLWVRPLPVPATRIRIPRLMSSLAWRSVTSPTERREQLKAVYEQAKDCTRCPLHQTRTTVVFGSGNADADLMFVGEAPGANEDKQGLPFVGQAGKLLTKLLSEIGLERDEVFICNTVKCRPPNNRDPHPNEIESCNEYLRRQVELIQPTVICTLGNFSTKLLRGDNTGISRLHGQPEVRTIGARAIRLYPLYHPAAALYTPSTLEVLRADFNRIGDLLAQGAPEQPAVPDEDVPEPADEATPTAAEAAHADGDQRPADEPSEPDAPESGGPFGTSPETVQLGLF